jgi:putative serine protease PepD
VVKLAEDFRSKEHPMSDNQDTTAQPVEPFVQQPAATAEPPASEPGSAFHRPAKEPRRTPVLPIVAALAVGALVGGATGGGVAFWAVSSNTGSPVTSGDLPTTVTVNDASDATQITAVAAKASPSVVTISVTAQAGGGTGSGVILSADGYVLTNTHVVTLDGAVADPTIKVTTNDGRVYDATVVGTDPISDLAVIKLTDAQDLQPAEFADSDQLNVGDTAIAIGAPLGLAGTVTNGIVSALNRSITIASSAVPEESEGGTDGGEQAPDQQGPFDFWQFDLPGQQQTGTASSTISLSVIQTDAAINPGNSGGALLDSDGKVIGINVAIASAGSSSGQSGNIGVGFSIPSNLAQRIADELIKDGAATHGLLGASVVDATSDPDANAEVVGALIKELTQGGGASNAGLQVGDIVTKFNGVPITGSTDLTAQVRSLAAGAKTELVYVRDGRATTVEVTLGQLQ